MQKINTGEYQLALDHIAGQGDIGVLFCGGFKSNRQGQKALALEEFCRKEQLPFVRFDYSGHGDSDGEFVDGNIEAWLNDTLSVIDHFEAPKKFVIIGSSMGAWIAVLAARERAQRMAGLITIAAAPDFTERLMMARFSQLQRDALQNDENVLLPSEYDDGSPYPISRQLIDNSRNQCVLGETQRIDVPVRMLHGTKDEDVPYELSIELMNAISSDDIELTLVKNGDHRLSSPDHQKLLHRTIKALVSTVG